MMGKCTVDFVKNQRTKTRGKRLIIDQNYLLIVEGKLGRDFLYIILIRIIDQIILVRVYFDYYQVVVSNNQNFKRDCIPSCRREVTHLFRKKCLDDNV